MKSRNSRYVGFESLESRRMFSGGSLPYGMVEPGSITSPTGTDAWTFSASKNDLIQITTKTGVGTNFRPHFQLKYGDGPLTGTLVVGGDWFGDGQFRPTPAAPLAQTGKYSLSVTDQFSDGTGHYSLDLEGLHPINPGGSALTMGAITPSTLINDPIQYKHFVFTAKAGDIVQFETATDAGTDFRPVYELIDPEGNTASDAVWFGNDVRTFHLSIAGKYLLQVSDQFNDGTGSFRIGFEGIKAPSPDAKPLTNNTKVSSTTNDPIQIDEYRFTAQGTSMSFDSLVGPGTNFRPYFALFDSAGNQIGNTWFGAATAQAFPTIGGAQYMLLVGDQFQDGTGNYSITAHGVASTNSAPKITSLSDTPDPAAQGATVTLTANGVSDPDNNLKQVQFYRESNGVAGLQTTGTTPDTLVGTDTSSSGGWTAMFSTTLLSPKAYTYYARATDANGAASGTVSTTNTIAPSNKPVFGILASDPNASESVFGSTGSSGAFTVYRKNITNTATSIILQLSGTAMNLADYTLSVTGTGITSSYDSAKKQLKLNFAAGATAASISVAVVNDNVKESSETVVLSILSSSTYTIDGTHPNGTVTIADKPTF